MQSYRLEGFHVDWRGIDWPDQWRRTRVVYVMALLVTMMAAILAQAVV